MNEALGDLPKLTFFEIGAGLSMTAARIQKISKMERRSNFPEQTKLSTPGFQSR